MSAPPSGRGSGRPVPGDVVVRQNRLVDDGPAYVVSAVPGPDQVGCHTLTATIRLARAYAAQIGVDVWRADGAVFTLIARFRVPASLGLHNDTARLGHALYADETFAAGDRTARPKVSR